MAAQEHEVSAKDLVREIGYNLDGDYLVGGECCVCKGPLVHAFGFGLCKKVATGGECPAPKDDPDWGCSCR